ncbi:MAG: hypothetical protein MJ185_09980 [Treponema sp.]|nr:hypothetical protein [Treponema sp.]
MRLELFINSLYEKVEKKEMSVTSAVNLIAEIIQENYKVFDPKKRESEQQQDFQSNVIFEFLRTGHKIFGPLPEGKDFYTVVCSRIRGIVQTQIKKSADSNKISLVNLHNSKNDFENEQEKYSFILVVDDKLSVPYAPKNSPDFKLKPVSLKEFMNKRSSFKEAKPAVISALRECYDIPDSIVYKLCEKYNIDSNDFFKNIQELKEIQIEKYERHREYCNNRNASFFIHQRYTPGISDYENASDSYKRTMKRRYETSTHQWELKNKKIKNGKFHYTPSNELLSQKLGICIRQISYYIKKTRELAEEEAL